MRAGVGWPFQGGGPVNRRYRWGLGCGVVLLSLWAGLALLWCFRVPILRGLAEAWIRDESTSGGADAIVVLGGGLETRPFRAAELYRQGVAPAIWVTRPEPEPTAKLGLKESSYDACLAVLQRLGVPREAIVPVGEGLGSTWDEALAVRALVRSQPGVRRLVVPTDPFHTRRVDWVFTHLLRQEGVEVRVVSVKALEYDPAAWWREESGAVAFHNEVLKYWFYRWRFSRAPVR